MLIFILILTSLNFVLPEGNIAQAESPLLIPTKGHQGKQNAHVISPLTLATEYYPFNVTIRHLSSRSIGISWNCKDSALNDRYEVMIKPVLASYKVVETVRNNMSCYLVMDKLQPDTTYQVAVSAIAGRNRKRSGYVFFKTFMEDDYTEFAEDDGSDHSDGTISDLPSPSTPNAKGPIFPRVRVVEITLVALALVLWAGAIVLFFHRWGKIRMLLPYQPDYKEMKNSNASCTTCSLTPHHQCQKIHHLPNPTGECFQAQGMTTPYHHPHQPHPPPLHSNTPYLPHQPLSEPGPSTSAVGEAHANTVTVTEAGCSPMRQKTPSLHEGEISIDVAVQRHHHLNSIKKARSAEHISKQYVYPWDEQHDIECTEF